MLFDVWDNNTRTEFTKAEVAEGKHDVHDHFVQDASQEFNKFQEMIYRRTILKYRILVHPEPSTGAHTRKISVTQ